MRLTSTSRMWSLASCCLAWTALAMVGCQGGGTQGKAASATACADYAKKVCDEAGEKTPTCAAMKQATDLMPAAACAAAMADFGATKTKLAQARKSCDELTQKLCADIGAETETCKMVQAQSKLFPPERCAIMMQHYGEVVANLKRREAANQPLTPDKVAAITKPGAPEFGPAGAKVTIVEFSDFQCPYCSRAASTVAKLKEKYGKQVRFVFHNYPLPFHQHARLAAEAAMAAHAQGKFWAFHDRLFADQEKLDRASLESTAKQVGLNVGAFKKALDGKTYAAAVDADLELGKTVNVSGTPTWFLNGTHVRNPTDIDAVSSEIEAALKK